MTLGQARFPTEREAPVDRAWPDPDLRVLTIGPGASAVENHWRMYLSTAAVAKALPTRIKTSKIKGLQSAYKAYLLQAHEYWAAYASLAVRPTVTGALFGNYASLNLAKAELCVTNPSSIHAQKVQLGMGVDNLGANKLENIEVTIHSGGVFPLLVASRTGQQISRSFRITLGQLMSGSTDSSADLLQYGLQRSTAVTEVHAIALADDTDKWLALAPGRSPTNLAEPAVQTQLTQHGFEVCAWSGAPLAGHETRVLLQTASIKRQQPGDLTRSEVKELLEHFESLMRRHLGGFYGGAREFGFTSAGGVVLNPELCRYASVYVLSSLVRYRPELVHEAAGGWLAASYLADALPPLIASFAPSIFGSRLRMRPSM